MIVLFDRQTVRHTKMTKIQTVEDLPGIGPAGLEKLTSAGKNNLLSIAVCSIAELAELTGMTEAKARAVIQAAREALPNTGLISAFDDRNTKQKTRFRIPSNSEALDKLLNGGFESGMISEAFGKNGAGKSQIAHQLCVNIQKLNPDFKAVYIDSENCFQPERIEEMAKAQDLDPEQVLKNIYKVHVFNTDHQMMTVDKDGEALLEKDKNIKLIIVDSIIIHFRHEFTGRGELFNRQAKLNRHASKLHELAYKYNLVIYITNQVMEDPAAMFIDPVKPAGGNILGHISRLRLYLRKSGKGVTAKLVKSANLTDGECIFQVTTNGIGD